jgi:hypothetical protein
MSDRPEKQGLRGRSKYRGWVFLALVCIFYGLIYWLFPQFGAAGMARVRTMAVELAPIFLLVFGFLWMT